jgi:hypothetical protein
MLGGTIAMWKKHFLVRVAGAAAITLWFGVAGALVGLGCHYLNPARYQSTGRIVVSGDDGTPGDPVARAAILAETAKSQATLSTAILVADLYHSDRDTAPLADLAKRLTFSADVTPVSYGRGARIDVSMTYTDREKVQRALDSVIRHVVSEDAPRTVRVGAFALDPRNASTPVRTGGFEPGWSLLAGFVGGLMLHSTYAQLRLAKLRNSGPRLWLQ